MSQTHSIVGFHIAGGGDKTGFGEWMHRLNAAGVPFHLKASDHYGDINAAIEEFYPQYGVENTLVFRAVLPKPNDVPRYDLHPEDAAEAYWPLYRAEIPPEFHKELVWLDVLNEPRAKYDHDKPNYDNMHPVDWLGEFSYYIAGIANVEGYKVCLPSFNGGEPEHGFGGSTQNDYELPGMIKYLRYCAENKDMAALSVHEYTRESDGDALAEDYYPHDWGRLEAAFAACDKNGISRDFYVFITEWGWEYENVPSATAGVDQMVGYDKWAATWPQVIGAATWTLQSGWGGISGKLTKYFEKMADYQTGMTFEVGHQPRATYHGTVPGDTDPEEPDMTLKEALIKDSVETQCVSLNPDAAYQRAILSDGFNIVSTEQRYKYAGTNYGYQTAESLSTGERRIYYSVVGDWSNVNYFVDDNNPVDPPIDPPPIDPPPPNNGDSHFGIHASADSRNLSDDVNIVNVANFEMIKVLSSHDPHHLPALYDASKAKHWVIRAFLSFNNNPATPAQFLERTESDVRRTLAKLVELGVEKSNISIEIHNEPNLTTEGLGNSWGNGREFNTWYLETLSRYRAAFPDVRLLFPGLSPGGDIPGLRINHRQFIEECRDAVNASDGLAIHSYWSVGYPMTTHPDAGIKLVDEFISRFPGKRIYITEASNNDHGVTQNQKAIEYVEFNNEMKKRDEVIGVMFFVLSASNPAWSWNNGSGEVWTLNMAEIASQR